MKKGMQNTNIEYRMLNVKCRSEEHLVFPHFDIQYSAFACFKTPDLHPYSSAA
jgi:hypothetical protein